MVNTSCITIPKWPTTQELAIKKDTLVVHMTRSPPDTIFAQMCLLWGFNRDVFYWANITERQTGRRVKVVMFFIIFFCFLLFCSLCPTAGGVIILCPGAALWSPPVTEMLRCRWAEELERHHFISMMIINRCWRGHDYTWVAVLCMCPFRVHAASVFLTATSCFVLYSLTVFDEE